MNVETFLKLDPKVVSDFIAFKWIRQNKMGGLDLPPIYYQHRDLESGKMCVGQALAIGSKVKDIKVGDFLIFGEYGADSGNFLQEDKVYFAPEKEFELILGSKKLDVLGQGTTFKGI